MTLLLIAFFLYLIGFIGAFFKGAGEFWLWFLALGIALDLTLILLADLGEAPLEFIRKCGTKEKSCHFLALLLAVLAAFLRLKAEISWFFLILSIILILWSYSIFNLFQTWRRKNQNE